MHLCDVDILGMCDYFLSRKWPIQPYPPTTEPPDRMKDINLYSFCFFTDKILFALVRGLNQEADTLLPLACLIS